MDAAIIAALQRRAEIEGKICEAEARIKRLKANLAEVSMFIAQWEKFSGRSVSEIGAKEATEATRHKIAAQPDEDESARTKNPKKEEVATAVREILLQHGKPMMRADLYKSLNEKGIHLNGANPSMVLSTMLWRTGDAFQIERLKTGGYWLSDRPQPAEPDSDDPPEPPDPYVEYHDPDAAYDDRTIEESLRKHRHGTVE